MPSGTMLPIVHETRIAHVLLKPVGLAENPQGVFVMVESSEAMSDRGAEMRTEIKLVKAFTVHLST